MTRKILMASATQILLLALILVSPVFGQGGRGGHCMMSGGCMMRDDAHAADMQVFQQLFDHRADITRRVLRREDGVESATESMNPEVTRLIQTHVAAMLSRVIEQRPIHQRDPLFAELFKYADRIDAIYEKTAGGVRVVETSRDAYVVKLLHAHAEVVSAFIANGRAELMKNHPLPPR